MMRMNMMMMMMMRRPPPPPPPPKKAKKAKKAKKGMGMMSKGKRRTLYEVALDEEELEALNGAGEFGDLEEEEEARGRGLQ